jgi:DNA-binding GntR family transcriptional regulator
MDRHQIAAIQGSPAVRRLVEREPLTRSVYQVVVDMLMTHTLEPGARLSIEELARTLGVSQTPIREALPRVEADGLIIKEPGRSYRVAPLMAIDQVRELIELRMLIEPAVAAMAADRATSKEVSELRALARTRGAGNETTAAANRLDMVYDATFHAMIAQLGRNQIIADTLSRLRSHMHTYRLYYHAGHHALTRTEHLAVVQAIGKHDPEGADAAMRVHLRKALERIEAFAAETTAGSPGGQKSE